MSTSIVPQQHLRGTIRQWLLNLGVICLSGIEISAFFTNHFVSHANLNG